MHHGEDEQNVRAEDAGMQQIAFVEVDLDRELKLVAPTVAEDIAAEEAQQGAQVDGILKDRRGSCTAGVGQIGVLREQARQAEDIRRENERLRQLFGWQQQQRWKHKLANVVLHDPANWWRTVQIDLGSRDGLSNNLAVLNLEGFLVGRVSSVSLTRSQVVLLGDPNCKVAARIQNEAGDAGIIGGSGPLDSEFVEMSYLSKNAYIKPGQIVKTSGDGGIFPKDIPVGKVADSRPAEYGLATVARVKLGANLNALEQVWVRFK